MKMRSIFQHPCLIEMVGGKNSSETKMDTPSDDDDDEFNVENEDINWTQRACLITQKYYDNVESTNSKYNRLHISLMGIILKILSENSSNLENRIQKLAYKNLRLLMKGIHSYFENEQKLELLSLV